MFLHAVPSGTLRGVLWGFPGALREGLLGHLRGLLWGLSGNFSVVSLGLLLVFSGASLGIFSVAFLGTHGASYAEPSEARLRATDEILFAYIRKGKWQERGQGEL